MIELVCIVCPQGCRLQVDPQNGYAVTGNACPRGEVYGKKEVTAPTRVLTSIVRIEGAMHPCCPVKTADAIPKEKIADAMALLRKVKLTSPVAIGDVVAEIEGTGVSWVVTKDM